MGYRNINLFQPSRIFPAYAKCAADRSHLGSCLLRLSRARKLRAKKTQHPPRSWRLGYGGKYSLANAFKFVRIILGLCFLLFSSIGQAAFWSSSQAEPGRISLLLPIRGAYADSAKAIRDGFIAAYYQSLAQDPNAPTIRIVDTGEGDIATLYQQAIVQGAQVIVGPLNKDEGSRLVQTTKLTVPTLVLNTLPGQQPIANLYQLSLSPEDEARQVAAKAWLDGNRKVAILAPDSAWGKRLTQSLLQEWQKLGGKAVGLMFYNSPEQFSSQVAQLLHVDQSELRAKSLQKQLQQPKLRAIPYRRQDIDAFFLVAKPDTARQLRPLLNFYFAGSIPVYATSHVYSGFPNPSQDQDLNGVIFCAIPWEISPESLSPDLQSVLQEVQKNWPQALQTQSQFFALGADSYHLARQILASTAPAAETQGATGKLVLQSNSVWFRELPWARMDQGQPKLLEK